MNSLQIYDKFKDTLSKDIFESLSNNQVKKVKYLRELSILKNKEFNLIIGEINRYYEHELLKGNQVNLGSGNGSIVVKLRTIPLSLKRINWGESNKLKQQLIDLGYKPYSKEEEQLAIQQGIKYEGVKWFIYDEEERVPFVVWNKPPTINVYYSATFNNKMKEDVKLVDICKDWTKQRILNSEKLGILRKLRLLINKNKLYLNTFEHDI
jgi:hypothetical protein